MHGACMHKAGSPPAVRRNGGPACGPPPTTATPPARPINKYRARRRLVVLFSRKPSKWKEGIHVFMAGTEGDRHSFVFGVVTGVDGDRLGINGIAVDPVGLRNKVKQGKAGPRSVEMLENPTSENCIFALVYRIEEENFTKVVDASESRVEMISPKAYAVLDGWVREELPEMINRVLSLPPGTERDAARRTLKQKSDTLLDKDLRRNLYSVCRSLKILDGQEGG